MVAKLPAKQKKFVEEYLVDLNATQAAIRAGYSQRTAEVQGPRLLGNVRVANAIAEAIKRRSERTEITQDQVLHEFARLGFSDLRNYIEWGPDGVTIKPSAELTEDQARAVLEVSETKTIRSGENWQEEKATLKFKLHDKKGSLDSMAKHLGMFGDASIYIDNRQQSLIQVIRQRKDDRQNDDTNS